MVTAVTFATPLTRPCVRNRSVKENVSILRLTRPWAVDRMTSSLHDKGMLCASKTGWHSAATKKDQQIQV